MKGQGKLLSASACWRVWDGLPSFDATPPTHEFLLKVLSGIVVVKKIVKKIVKKTNYETTEQCL